LTIFWLANSNLFSTNYRNYPTKQYIHIHFPLPAEQAFSGGVLYLGLSQGRRGAQLPSDLKPVQLVPAPLKVPIFGRRKFQNEPVGMLRQASTL